MATLASTVALPLISGCTREQAAPSAPTEADATALLDALAENLLRLYPEGATAYNVVAEIPGSDKAQEVVMLGGHIDSWHAATGATDNAIGCATMMEAIRLL